MKPPPGVRAYKLCEAFLPQCHFDFNTYVSQYVAMVKHLKNVDSI